MRRILTALAVTALATLVGCSSDDKEEASTDTSAPVVTTSPAGQTPTSAGGVKYTGDKNSPFCEVGRANNDRLEGIGAAVANPDDLNALLREAAPAVRQAASLAPPEIKSDVTVLADGFEQLLKSLESGEPDISLVLEPRFQAAAENLTAYGRDVCGITE